MRRFIAGHHRSEGLPSFRLALLLFVLWSAGSQAQRPAVGRDDVQWLQAMQIAAQRLNYTGTIIHQQGADMRSSRIVHFFDGAVAHERLQTLDGRLLEVLRRADEVRCLIPEARRIVIDKRLGGENFPAITSGGPAEILRHYTLRLDSLERVADIECQIIVLEPKDSLRYGYRLCADPASGLLLKAQMLNDRQETLEQMAFSEVRIGERFDAARLRPSWVTDGWSVERNETRPADLARAGWTVVVPDGFRKLNAVRRTILFAGGSREAMQAVFTDGLATFSVFIEATSTRVDAARSQGSVNAYVRRIGDALVTVVGEVPAATVRTVAMSMQSSSGGVAPPVAPGTSAAESKSSR